MFGSGYLSIMKMNGPTLFALRQGGEVQISIKKVLHNT